MVVVVVVVEVQVVVVVVAAVRGNFGKLIYCSAFRTAGKKQVTP